MSAHSPIGPTARLVRVPLPGVRSPHALAACVGADGWPVVLTGAWADGRAIVASDPVEIAKTGNDPFGPLDRQPLVEADDDDGGGVGGGWFGFFGFQLAAGLEPVPPPPPRPTPMPHAALAFYDHVVRCDQEGRWWFEALWTDLRAAVLRARLELWRARLSDRAPRPTSFALGRFRLAPPGLAGHRAAVAACLERIAAGEIFQANLCLRLEAAFAGEPIALFARAAAALEPPFAAALAGPWGAIASLSPELFLRRRGRAIVTEPIKGTAARADDAACDERGREQLAASAKDRAENVMIVDLMRNDLGRVCAYGSVVVEELAAVRPHPGVWHLVSTVAGRLRPGVGDAALLGATFPPGSVTGAPKVRALQVIGELEATGREAYTGAIGYASPIAGLELNVAIRTFEFSANRVWLGVGGGIVAGSNPDSELRECLVKAQPLVAAAGGSIVAEPCHGPDAWAELPSAAALSDTCERPDARHGVFETLLVLSGGAWHVEEHLARLQHSVGVLYGLTLPGDLPARIGAAASRLAGDGRVRVSVRPDGAVSVQFAAPPPPDPVVLRPVLLPGGLGAHKWSDRRLLDGLKADGCVALLVDLDGHVLEAAHANVFAVQPDRLVTPPLDGRLLPGTGRARLIAHARWSGLEVTEEPVTLQMLRSAREIVLTSSLRGVHGATLERVSSGADKAFARRRRATTGRPAASRR